MKYRINPKNGDELSILGYGCMRFSRKGAAVDQEKTDAELLAAIEAGVNYFDTAYIYPGSEAALGRFMEKYGCRERMKLATKLPHYLLKKEGDAERYFNEELSRLKTDHVDYYLMHMLADVATWKRLEDLGVKDWLEKKKAEGVIRNIGFSYHGNTANFLDMLSCYDWDFCQIQFNYMDENTQAGLEGLRAAGRLGIPVIIMEPLRGGRLADKLPKGALKLINEHEPHMSPAQWALRWIWNHSEATVVLSGMNDLKQIEENCQAASESEAGILTAGDLEMFAKIRQEVNSSVKVGCTGCGYCQPCPKGVAIPTCFAYYNASFSDGYLNSLKDYFMTTSLRKNKANAGLCVGCGLCAARCGQNALRMENGRVEIDPDECIRCQDCFGPCPAVNFRATDSDM